MSTETHEQARSAGSAQEEDSAPLVSVVIPCLNEEQNIERCVGAAWAALERMGLASDGACNRAGHGETPDAGGGRGRRTAEVIVVDNGSEDDSARLAREAGARVVAEPRRGYGRAYLTGFAEARGRYIVMADADLTYDFGDIPRFIAQLDEGAELVMGDRMDDIQPGAMPWLHRYIGNPILTGILNLFFKTGVSDAHCGMRALRSDVLPRLDLRATGMEFASEMVVRASKERLRIAEVPITYHPRGGESKLSSFRDGWRHLRYLLVHSPTHLFILPGLLLAILGALIMGVVGGGLDVFGRAWGIHALIGGALLTIVGIQVLALGLCAHAYGTYFMGEREQWFDWARSRLRLEHGLMLGSLFILAGLALGGLMLATWISHGFGSLSDERIALVGATLLIVGIQIIFSSFLLSIIGLRR
ncbi:MAG TPA: glycosyltransferase family 2 protein [Solirubrobacteraceae bacterium]|nr:glycosyltransferase family 2 protein [Solirubrobacteraceae bacterium]